MLKSFITVRAVHLTPPALLLLLLLLTCRWLRFIPVALLVSRSFPLLYHIHQQWKPTLLPPTIRTATIVRMFLLIIFFPSIISAFSHFWKTKTPMNFLAKADIHPSTYLPSWFPKTATSARDGGAAVFWRWGKPSWRWISHFSRGFSTEWRSANPGHGDRGNPLNELGFVLVWDIPGGSQVSVSVSSAGRSAGEFDCDVTHVMDVCEVRLRLFVSRTTLVWEEAMIQFCAIILLQTKDRVRWWLICWYFGKRTREKCRTWERNSGFTFVTVIAVSSFYF